MRQSARNQPQPPLDEKMRPYNVRIEGRRTSVRLEPREWEILRMICQREGITIHQFCTSAVLQRREHNQTARIRVALLDYLSRRSPVA